MPVKSTEHQIGALFPQTDVRETRYTCLPIARRFSTAFLVYEERIERVSAEHAHSTLRLQYGKGTWASDEPESAAACAFCLNYNKNQWFWPPN
jgi:hypothetical protein